MRALLICCSILVATLARADEIDPDTERAQRLFALGAEAYGARDYPRALKYMEAARRLRPLPALDYNIARCHDRLGDDRAALEAYRRYANHAAQDLGEVRLRIDELDRRITEAEAARRRLVAPSLVGVLGVALLATGGGLAGSAASRYEALEARWLSFGPTPDVVADADVLQARERAGWALLGIGGVAIAVDAVLWGLYARRRGPRAERAAR